MKSELYFLIAKFLRNEFPRIHNDFVAECDRRQLFPSLLFQNPPSFSQLDEQFLNGISDEQLEKITKLPVTKTETDFPSLFFVANSNPVFVSLPDALSLGFGPSYPPLDHLAPSYRIFGHFDTIFCLATDKSGQILISGADDFVIKLWKIPTMDLIKVFTKHTNVITDIAVHPSNHYFASSSHDHTICLFNLKQATEVHQFHMRDEVHSIKFSSCGKFLGAACQEGCIAIWEFDDALAGKPPSRLISTPGRSPAGWLGFSPGGSFIVAAADPSNVFVISLDGNFLLLLEGPKQSLDFVYFSKRTSDKIIGVSTKGFGVRLWVSVDKPWDRVYHLKAPQNKSRFNHCSWNCDETRILALSKYAVFVWDSTTREYVTSCHHPHLTEYCTLMVPHPTIPSLCFVGCISGRSAIWDINSGTIFNTLRPDESYKLIDAIWSPDGQYLFVSDVIGGITVFGYSHKGFSTVEMFFDFEVPEDVNPSRHDETNITYVDVQGVPLNPQPMRVYIQDINLDSTINISEATRRLEEETITRLYNEIPSMMKLESDSMPSYKRAERLDVTEEPSEVEIQIANEVTRRRMRDGGESQRPTRRTRQETENISPPRSLSPNPTQRRRQRQPFPNATPRQRQPPLRQPPGRRPARHSRVRQGSRRSNADDDSSSSTETVTQTESVTESVTESEEIPPLPSTSDSTSSSGSENPDLHEKPVTKSGRVVRTTQRTDFPPQRKPIRRRTMNKSSEEEIENLPVPRRFIGHNNLSDTETVSTHSISDDSDHQPFLFSDSEHLRKGKKVKRPRSKVSLSDSEPEEIPKKKAPRGRRRLQLSSLSDEDKPKKPRQLPRFLQERYQREVQEQIEQSRAMNQQTNQKKNAEKKKQKKQSSSSQEETFVFCPSSPEEQANRRVTQDSSSTKFRRKVRVETSASPSDGKSQSPKRSSPKRNQFTSTIVTRSHHKRK